MNGGYSKADVKKKRGKLKKEIPSDKSDPVPMEIPEGGFDPNELIGRIAHAENFIRQPRSRSPYRGGYGNGYGQGYGQGYG